MVPMTSGNNFQSFFHRRCFKKGVLKNFAKFTGKYLCQRLIFNKAAGQKPATLLKKKRWHRCFPMNFAKFLTTLAFIAIPMVADS